MKVTVLTPAIAARLYGPPQRPTATYAVAAPDGLFWGPTFTWAREFAQGYGLTVVYL
jgi:hypothetical protein